MESPVRQPDPAGQAAPSAPAEPCPHCAAPLADGQDWCLECGSAGEGRLRRSGARDATRAMAAVVGTVVLLVCGASAAGYAALTDDPTPAPVVAAAPGATTAPAAAEAAPTDTATATAAATPPATTRAELPALTTSSTPPEVPESTSTPKADEQQAAKEEEKSPADTPGLQALTLGPDAARLYDPSTRVADSTDPADSHDDDAKTLFTITTPAETAAAETSTTATTTVPTTTATTTPTTTTPATVTPMGVGLDLSFGTTGKKVRAVEIHTTTPGFSVEVYGATAGLPTAITDTAWKHLGDAAKVASSKDAKGAVTIEFERGRYRHVLLWFTTPPTAGPSVAISEVRLLD